MSAPPALIPEKAAQKREWEPFLESPSMIAAPRDRDTSFVPKRGIMINGLENIIISLYAKGISVSDIGV